MPRTYVVLSDDPLLRQGLKGNGVPLHLNSISWKGTVFKPVGQAGPLVTSFRTELRPAQHVVRGSTACPMAATCPVGRTVSTSKEPVNETHWKPLQPPLCHRLLGDSV